MYKDGVTIELQRTFLEALYSVESGDCFVKAVLPYNNLKELESFIENANHEQLKNEICLIKRKIDNLTY